MEIIQKYFPELSKDQISKFGQLFSLYKDWNSKINIVSRKDIDQLNTHHVLHSMAIAKLISFKANTKILDVGTGGGFPGIPLAILFPECQFHLVDSIAKKIKVVNAVADELNLKNVKAEQIRAEEIKSSYDFVVSRAVTQFPEFHAWVRNKVSPKQFNSLINGIIYLKGGDLTEELKKFKRAQIYPISNYFEESFFETKKVVYLPL